MKAHVSAVRLANVATLLSGGTPRKGDERFWDKGNIPWLTPKDMGRWNGDTEAHVTQMAIGNGTRFAPSNTVFLAVRGMSLHNEIRLLRADRTMSFNQDIKAIVPGNGMNQAYLYYALQAQKSTLLGSVEASGHGTGTLPTGHIENLIIPRFGEEAERALGEMFAALDDKIELNRRINETLEASARTLFRDWFVDFGPTRVKACGGPAYLASDLWSLFPERLDDGDKPIGWEWSTIGAEVHAVGGSTPSTKDTSLWDGGVAWTTPKDLSGLNSPILSRTSRTISEAGLRTISSGLLPAGTVLMSSRAPVGYLAIAQIPVAINQGYIAMRCDRRISNWAAYLWAKENMEAIIQNANGSTFQEISKANFRPLPILVASDAVRQQFDAVIGPMFEQIIANDRESRTLAETRDTLLPKLMSGEIRVSNPAENQA